jgi:pSer/pThr/pTyr-binding forkhead associated (FHA) protein
MFCQECGQRLGAAVHPTTSTAGGAVPATSPLAATAASPVIPAQNAAGPPSKARPLAPEVSFVRRDAAPAAPAPATLTQTGANAWATVACSGCGTSNQSGMRFCIGCGRPLSAPEEDVRGAGALGLMRTAEARSPLAEPDHLPSAPIEPARVIDIGAAASSPGSARACPRCHGAYDPGAQFCRFCGLPLSGLTPGNAAAAPPSISLGVPPSRPVAGLAPYATDVVASAATLSVEPMTPPPSPSPRPVPARARIVLIRRDGSEGAAHTLGTSTDVGRIEGQIVFPDDQYVSPRHARIIARGGSFCLRDLDSTNGVFMRIPFATRPDDDGDSDDKTTLRGNHSEAASEPVSDQPLADQELFLVGQQVLRFEVVRQAEEAFGPASENGTLLFGTPAAPRFARLSQRTVEGVVRDVFHLRKAETVIGRESGDIVFTDDPFLSRRHAVVRFHGGDGQKRRFTLADLGSSNGTFLRIRDEVRLRHGDHFRIGQQLLRFDIDASTTGI